MTTETIVATDGLNRLVAEAVSRRLVTDTTRRM